MTLPRFLFAGVAFLGVALPATFAQSTAFTYQGRLDASGQPANGLFSLKFTLHNAATGGAVVGTPLTNAPVGVTNGLFTVALDFGLAPFDGADRWLELGVRTNGLNTAHTVLSPRQAVTATPYAIRATTAGTAATVTAGGVAAGQLAAGAVTAAKLAANAVNSAIIADGSVSLADLGPDVGVWTKSGVNLSYSGGNVGIGTATPFFPLQVRAGVNQNLVVEPGSNIGIPGAVSIRGVNDANSDNIPVVLHGTPISLLGTTVGIGTTSPAAWLDVRGTGVGGIALGDYNITSSRYIGIIKPGDPANITAGSGFSGVEFGGPNTPDSGFIAFHTHHFANPGAGEKMRIDKTGNVGIGTTTPNATLQVVTLNSYPTPGLSLAGSVPELTLSLQNTSANGRNWAVLSSGTGSGLAGALRFFDSTAGVDRMLINAAGNVGIGTFAPATTLDVAGEVTCTAVNLTSDRNAKEQFKPVSAREVLAKVAALPITEWQYKTQGDARHIGPMAQDFHAAFGTGRDDKHITSVDADGVALAAIQGLNEKLDEKTREVDELKQSVAELRKLVSSLAR